METAQRPPQSRRACLSCWRGIFPVAGASIGAAYPRIAGDRSERQSGWAQCHKPDRANHGCADSHWGCGVLWVWLPARTVPFLPFYAVLLGSLALLFAWLERREPRHVPTAIFDLRSWRRPAAWRSMRSWWQALRGGSGACQ